MPGKSPTSRCFSLRSLWRVKEWIGLWVPTYMGYWHAFVLHSRENYNCTVECVRWDLICTLLHFAHDYNFLLHTSKHSDNKVELKDKWELKYATPNHSSSLVILLIRGLEILPEDLASCRLGNLSNELDATGQMLVCRERSSNVALRERL